LWLFNYNKQVTKITSVKKFDATKYELLDGVTGDTIGDPDGVGETKGDDPGDELVGDPDGVGDTEGDPDGVGDTEGDDPGDELVGEPDGVGDTEGDPGDELIGDPDGVGTKGAIPGDDDPEGVAGEIDNGAVGDTVGVVGELPLPHTVLAVLLQVEAVELHKVQGTQLLVALQEVHPEDQLVPLIQDMQFRDEYKTDNGKRYPVIANAEFAHLFGSV